MPSWFVILAKVLSLLANLVPVVESEFGSAPGSGPEKKAAVMARVGAYVDGPIRAQYPTLTPEQVNALGRVASAAIDQVVSAANRTGVFTRAPKRGQGATSDPPEGAGSGPGGGSLA